ncbi:MAG: hypothetical protein A2138_13755 [Deltaproteobacteria bacterium RBG_16_71_12]|nr:MAG: hypothetical protein A2138_13755 [Deltaproteobacteria bacterium RBG_16_71_12]
MRHLRYSKSGHLMREQRRAAQRPSRETLVRAGVIVAAVTLPTLVALVAPRRDQRPLAPAAAPSGQVLAALPPPARPEPPPAPAAPPPPELERVEARLADGEALSTALQRSGVGADDTSDLVRALKDHVDMRGLRAGASFSVVWRPLVTGARELVRVELRTLSGEGVPRTVLVEREPAPITQPEVGARFLTRHHDAPIETKVEGLSGAVRSSLYQSMLEAGEEAVLVNKFVDVFAWNVDFYRQTQRGDEWRVVVEKRYAGGRFLGYGKVLAAEYVNAGSAHRGFLFDAADGMHAGTYDEEGNALQRTFLKNPMEIARVTSSYGMRFHPVLGKNKQHQGVDYGAPTGTPVWSVADGVVKEARFSSTAGNMIVVQHMNGITTEYFHLSKFADGIKAGARVKQKQPIGLVGNTGTSTGSHLHFGMLRAGSHVDPAKQKFPNARPIPKEYRDELQRFIAPLLAQLQALDRA